MANPVTLQLQIHYSLVMTQQVWSELCLFIFMLLKLKLVVLHVKGCTKIHHNDTLQYFCSLGVLTKIVPCPPCPLLARKPCNVRNSCQFQQHTNNQKLVPHKIWSPSLVKSSFLSQASHCHCPRIC